MANAAESYDIVLESFLRRFLTRSEIANTIIVVRADHGLQAGPQTADYSLQIEALRPWTEIIVPKTLPGMSLSNLFDNQHRLTTGFDLYKTLTTSIIDQDQSLVSEHFPWTHHLWEDGIPETRTCKDAHVPLPYCIYESQRALTSPNFRTCNLFELDQTIMCPHYRHVFQRNMSMAVANVFYSHRVKAKACPYKDQPHRSNDNTIGDSSGTIETANDKSKNVGHRYPFHASLLTAILSELGDAVLKTEHRSITVCQTGFTTEQIPSMILNASTNVELLLFDSLERPSQLAAVDFVEKKFGARRVTVHKGDPCETLPNVLQSFHCDFLYGLSGTTCAADIINLVKRAPCGILLVSGSVSDLQESDGVYFDANGQWTTLRAEGCIKPLRCFSDFAPIADGNAKSGSAEKKAGKFCIAVTTGVCSSTFGSQDLVEETKGGSCFSEIARISKHLEIQRVCYDHDIPIPWSDNA
jgi:Protein of unknown function (DUF229)